MDHGEESSPNDRIWIRGANTDPYVELADLTTPSTTNGAYVDYLVDLSAALVGASQNFSATTQLRFGQEDNFPASSTTASDGLTFDDISIEEQGPNAGVVGLIAPPLVGCGDPAQMITVEVSAGNEAISGVPVTVDVTGDITASFSTTIAGPIAAGTTEVVSVGPIDTTLGGFVDITVTTTQPGDLDPTNDVLVVTGIELIGSLVPLAAIPVACPGYEVDLSVVPETGQGYAWFDAAVAGNEVGTGPTFTTPVIPGGGASYWVERTTGALAVGPLSNTAVGGGGNYSNFPDGLVFDVVGQTVALTSMVVYPDGAGDVVLNVLDANDVVVDTDTVAVAPSVAGEATTITTNLSVPPGVGYQINAVGTTTGGLYRNTGGAVYPFTDLGGTISITGPINALSGYYYFFYDIQGNAAGCPGPRVEVAVTSGVSGCEADLSISLGEPVAPLIAGMPYDWTLDIVNNGPHPATGVTLDAVPDAAATFLMNAGDCTLPFVCALADLAPGATAQVVSSWNVASDFDIATLFENSFTVAATEVDPAAGDESATSSLAVEREIDLSLAVAVAPDPPVSGGLATYIVEVTNNGPSDASGVTAGLTLPEGWVVAESLGCAEDPSGGSPCTLGSIAAGATAIIEFDVLVPVDQVDPFTAFVEVAGFELEVAPGDESASIESTPVQISDLQVAVDDDLDPVDAGGALSYHVTVSNAGPSVAKGVSLQFTAASEFTAALVEGCDATLLCVLGEIAVDAEVSIDIPGTVAADASGLIESTAVVSSDGTDDDEANNTATEDTAVTVVADLSLTGSFAPESAVAGQDEVVVSLTAANAGPSPVDDAAVSLLLPAGVNVSDAGDCSAVEEIVTCSLLELAADGAQTVTFTVGFEEDAEGTLTVTGEITFGGREAAEGDETVSFDLVVTQPATGDDDDDGRPTDACACTSSLVDAGPSRGLWGLVGVLALGLRRHRSRG